MFRVDTKKGCKLFAHEEDANNYKDFLENGLKIVGRSCGGWLFNDGSVLFDVIVKSFTGDGSGKKYSLKKGNKTITNEKLQKKYIAILQQKS